MARKKLKKIPEIRYIKSTFTSYMDIGYRLPLPFMESWQETMMGLRSSSIWENNIMPIVTKNIEDLIGLEKKARKTRSSKKRRKYREAAERILDHIALVILAEMNYETKKWRQDVVKLLVFTFELFFKALFTPLYKTLFPIQKSPA